MSFSYADIFHDLKSPLCAIKGFADAMLDGTASSQDFERYLKIISEQSSRMNDMINAALDLARAEFVCTENDSINVSAMILEILCLFDKSIVERDIDVSFDNPKDVFFTADKGLLERLFSNLISNAVKYCNAGGYVKLSVMQSGDNMTFSIKNSGKGIPAEKLPFIFERFARADSSCGGNGIGLASAKTIAEFYSGDITAVSYENEFTEFNLILPYTR